MAKKVYEWEGDTTQARGNFTWKSKKFLLPVQAAFPVARVKFTGSDRTDYQAQVEAYNIALAPNRALISALSVGGVLGIVVPGAPVPVGGGALTVLPTLPAYTGDDELQLKVYVDGTLVATKEVYHEKPFRIASRRGRTIEVEIIGNVTVAEVIVATSVKELKGTEEE